MYHTNTRSHQVLIAEPGCVAEGKCIIFAIPFILLKRIIKQNSKKIDLPLNFYLKPIAILYCCLSRSEAVNVLSNFGNFALLIHWILQPGVSGCNISHYEAELFFLCVKGFLTFYPFCEFLCYLIFSVNRFISDWF